MNRSRGVKQYAGLIQSARKGGRGRDEALGPARLRACRRRPSSKSWPLPFFSAWAADFRALKKSPALNSFSVMLIGRDHIH